VNTTIIKVQKLWRGWITRHLLCLAGPGVLNKSLRHNEEDLVTFESTVHPMNYFAFEEDGKVFWFDIRSIFQMSIGELQPTNPYTRSILSLDTRKRMKECIIHREFRHLSLFHDPLHLKNTERVFEMRWMMVSQMLEESLSIDVNPMFFIALNSTQLMEFTALFRIAMYNWAKEKSKICSRKNLYHFWISTLFKRQLSGELTTKQACYCLGGLLLKILKDSKNPHDLCFKILSARYNL